MRKCCGRRAGRGEVALEGSFAKGTWLATSPEIDVFILLEQSFDHTKVKGKVFPRLYKALRDLNPKARFSEHPYLVVELEGFTVEVIPATRGGREGEFRTAVDRTPLHTEYVASKTDAYMRDQIRLLKQFAKTIGVYGAEIAVEGFSGYLLELLVIHYKGFRRALEAASGWRRPVIIDTEGHYKGKNENEILKAFGRHPLIVIDPVDPKRNVASAVSHERLGEFIMASRLYLKRPSIHFFFPPKIGVGERKRLLSLLEEHFEKTVVVDIKLPKTLPPDTIWGEAKRARRNIEGVLERGGFEALRCSTWTNERDRVLIACFLEEVSKPQITGQKGPPIESFEHSINFVEKYLLKPGCGPWIKNGRLYALKERNHPTAISLLRERGREYLISDLKSGRVSVYLLSWKPEVLEDEPGAWLEEFVLGKPRWLLPYYLLLERE